MNDLLAAQLAELPQGPGCYLFRDAADRILYIGKAVNLRSRVRSYFREDRAASGKTRALALRVARVETIGTRNGIEALALENNLIKQHQPFFNIRLRDDSTYPFIKLTTDEAYPRLLVVRRRKADGARYFGPFPDSGAMRATLFLVGRLFPLRKKRTPPFRNRPCLNFDIGRCLAPCQGRIDQVAYDQMVRDVERFLEGRHGELLGRLRKDMESAAGNLDFERAARLRDLLRSVERLQERQLVVGRPDEECDALAVALRDGWACIEQFQVREGKVVSRREHIMDLPDGSSTGEADLVPQVLGAFIAQGYATDEAPPPEILASALPEDQEALEAWLAERRGGKVRLLVPQRGARRQLLDMVQENAEHGAGQHALARSVMAARDPHQALAILAAAVGMENLPERIEGFDISHSQGTDPVASMVVFAGGQPLKSDYRKFRIKHATGGDDFASMKEVVGRRYRQVREQGADMPDLILIDGGKGQLGAALEALHELGITDQPIFGLAKRIEEIFLPGRTDPVLLAEDSPGRFLIQRVRDEAHRFAVTFHRGLRGKHMTESALDGVPGIGQQRKKALLGRLGSVDAIRGLSATDLALRGGIPRAVAEAVLAHLNRQEDPPGA